MKPNRTYQEPLPAALAEALLHHLSQVSGGSIWGRLTRAVQELESAVAEANTSLGSNPLTPMIANMAMKDIGRRGTPTVVVSSSGQVLLSVQYEQVDVAVAVTADPSDLTGCLPSISDLRNEAKVRGIDPTPFGQSKKQLLQVLKTSNQSQTPPPIPVVSVGPPEEPPFDLYEEEYVVMDEGHSDEPAPIPPPRQIEVEPEDLSFLFKDLDLPPQPTKPSTHPAPVQKPVIATSAPERPKPKKNLSGLIQAADSIDLDALKNKH